MATPIEDDRVTGELFWREPLLLAMSAESACAEKDRLCAPDLAKAGNVGVEIVCGIHIVIVDQKLWQVRMQALELAHG